MLTLTTENIVTEATIHADVESLRLSKENTITNTITVQKTHIVYNDSLNSSNIIVNSQILRKIGIK